MQAYEMTMKPRRPLLGPDFTSTMRPEEPKAWVRLRPSLSFWQVRKAWLLYHGEYYAVETMQDCIFRAAVREAYPSFAMSAIYCQPYPFDIVDRWYILMRYPLKLFFKKKGEFVDRYQ
jgi:hypothetical protein